MSIGKGICFVQMHYIFAVKLWNVLLHSFFDGNRDRNGHADGFINIPLDELRERIKEIPVNKPVYVMCQSGVRSYIACRILTQNGYDSYNCSGGYAFYNAVMNNVLASKEIYPCGMEKK